MDGNEIECDCNLKDFKSAFTNKDSRVYKVLQPDELHCSYPRSLRGKNLTEVDLNTVACISCVPPCITDPPKHSSWIGFIVGIILTALVFFLYPQYKRYRVTQNYPRRHHGKSQNGCKIRRPDFFLW